MKVYASAFVLLKVSSCAQHPTTEIARFTDEASCMAVAAGMAETNSNDWLGRKGLDRFVCIPEGSMKP